MSRVYMEVDLKKIANNVQCIRNAVSQTAKLMAVVKADGYGHGAVEVSKAAIQNGADWLGVAICEEGILLRKAGITTPILILGYTPQDDMEQAIYYDLTQTIYCMEIAKKLSHIAKKQKKTAQIHIKIDTGMSRIGFSVNDKSSTEIKQISQLDNIEITGIYTHLAEADSQDKTFSISQYKKFLGFLETLDGVQTGIRHISNSAAVLELGDFALDMVRTGILVYGLYPSENISLGSNLQPAMSLKSYISFVKEVDEGASVGYGRTYFATRKMKVATVPVGYADGYSRFLSNIGRVIVKGKYANIVGNICMDQFMIDVTHIKDVFINEEVVLIGTQQDIQITVDEIAKLGNTINHEIVCSIGKRVPRIYI